MKLVSNLAVAAALVAGAVAAALVAGAVVASPAAAQSKPAEAPKPPERKFNISKEAQKAIGELRTSVNAKAADFPQRLAAAQAVAKTNDDKYIIAKFQLQRAMENNDKAAQRVAVEAILASGGAEAAETATLRRYLAAQSINSGDFVTAERVYTERLAADPNDIDNVVNLSRAKLELKKPKEALDLLQRAIGLAKAAGKQPEEAWYRKSLELAHQQKNIPLALQMARDALAAYPSEVNLRNALIVFQDGPALDKQADLDLLRLMRSTKVMSGPGAYVNFAHLLNDEGLPGEAKAVLDEGKRLNILKGGEGAQLLAALTKTIAEDRASLPGVEAKARASANGVLAMRTAAAFAGYGEHAKAIDLYKVALAKGGVESNLINTRLGMSLAAAGRKAEAEAAFKAVTGSRAQLAAFWLSWIKLQA